VLLEAKAIFDFLAYPVTMLLTKYNNRQGVVMSDSSFLHIDAKRFETVCEDTAVGSEPGARFYIFVAVSTLIASFGLVTNSTAVVIGAMLVAPLMTPIYGISLL